MSIEWLDEQPGSGGGARSAPRRTRRLPRRRSVAVPVVVLLVGLGVGAAIGRSTATSPKPARSATLTVAGSVELVRDFERVGGDTPMHCIGSGEFGDVTPGSALLVSNTTPQVLGGARLGSGTLSGGACRFPFQLTVAASGSFFELLIGQHPTSAYPRADLGDLIITLD